MKEFVELILVRLRLCFTRNLFGCQGRRISCIQRITAEGFSKFDVILTLVFINGCVVSFD